MLWDFLAIAEWAKRRGLAGRDQPCLWCIDEVSALTNLHALQHSILGEDINEIATQYARNVGLQLLYINQTVSQLPPAIVTALSQFGTKLVGNLPLLDDALYLAQLLYAYDPHRVRKHETVWANDPIPEYHATGLTSTSIFARANYIALDERTTEYTIDEQYQVVAQALRQLPKFHFLVKAAAGEGDLTGDVRHVTFERLINGRFPDPAALEQPLAQLRRKWGVPIAELLREIEQRPQQALIVRPVKAKQENGILAGDSTHAHPVSTNQRKHQRRPTGPQAEPRPASSSSATAADDAAWQSELWTPPDEP